MPDDVSFRSAAPGKAPVPDFSAWLGGQDRALQMWGQFSYGMMKSYFNMAQEIMTFSQGRWQAAMGAWQQLAACRSPSELFDRQRQFAEETNKQYFEAANKLAMRMLELARGAQEQTPKQ